jgi:predicted nuclease of predicted toxin-antitoxin system
VKLLFDQNLSPRLVNSLGDTFPGSVHVRDVGLERASDQSVWEYAAAQALTIVSKDADFHQRSLVFGHPPKVVWIRLGNCRTQDIEDLLRRHAADVRRFLDDADAAFLALG